MPGAWTDTGESCWNQARCAGKRIVSAMDDERVGIALQKGSTRAVEQMSVGGGLRVRVIRIEVQGRGPSSRSGFLRRTQRAKHRKGAEGMRRRRERSGEAGGSRKREDGRGREGVKGEQDRPGELVVSEGAERQRREGWVFRSRPEERISDQQPALRKRPPPRTSPALELDS